MKQLTLTQESTDAIVCEVRDFRRIVDTLVSLCSDTDGFDVEAFVREGIEAVNMPEKEPALEGAFRSYGSQFVGSRCASGLLVMFQTFGDELRAWNEAHADLNQAYTLCVDGPHRIIEGSGGSVSTGRFSGELSGAKVVCTTSGVADSFFDVHLEAADAISPVEVTAGLSASQPRRLEFDLSLCDIEVL